MTGEARHATFRAALQGAPNPCYASFMTPPAASGRSARPFTVVDGSAPPPPALAGAVVAIGNFDGLHRGHMAVIGRAEAIAADAGRPVAILTFEPHPRTFFRPADPVFRLTPIGVKEDVGRALGLDGAVVMTFDAALAATSAREFIEGILIGRLGIGGLVIGHDFHFGKGREGSPEMIVEAGARLGIPVVVVDAMKEGDAPVSSSMIRAALGRGDVEKSAELLGYRWFVRGEVMHGDKRGRLLGYPTANMILPKEATLAHGIYAVRMAIDGAVRDGVASFGRRPTFDDGAPRLETFLFDFSGDLYGKTVDVEFCAFIRGEEKFDTVEALIARMDADSAIARTALARPADIPARSLLPLR